MSEVRTVCDIRSELLELLRCNASNVSPSDIDQFRSDNLTCAVFTFNEAADTPSKDTAFDSLTFSQLLVKEGIACAVVDEFQQSEFLTIIFCANGLVICENFVKFAHQQRELVTESIRSLTNIQNDVEKFLSELTICHGNRDIEKFVANRPEAYLATWLHLNNDDTERNEVMIQELHGVFAKGNKCGLFVDVQLPTLPHWISEKPTVHKFLHGLRLEKVRLTSQSKCAKQRMQDMLEQLRILKNVSCRPDTEPAPATSSGVAGASGKSKEDETVVLTTTVQPTELFADQLSLTQMLRPLFTDCAELISRLVPILLQVVPEDQPSSAEIQALVDGCDMPDRVMHSCLSMIIFSAKIVSAQRRVALVSSSYTRAMVASTAAERRLIQPVVSGAVDDFQLLLVPIHMNGHWTLVIYDSGPMQDIPTAYFMDSLHPEAPIPPLVLVIINAVLAATQRNNAKRPTIRKMNANWYTRQINVVDCGLDVCMVAANYSLGAVSGADAAFYCPAGLRRLLAEGLSLLSVDVMCHSDNTAATYVESIRRLFDSCGYKRLEDKQTIKSVLSASDPCCVIIYNNSASYGLNTPMLPVLVQAVSNEMRCFCVEVANPDIVQTFTVWLTTENFSSENLELQAINGSTIGTLLSVCDATPPQEQSRYSAENRCKLLLGANAFETFISTHSSCFVGIVTLPSVLRSDLFDDAFGDDMPGFSSWLQGLNLDFEQETLDADMRNSFLTGNATLVCYKLNELSRTHHPTALYIDARLTAVPNQLQMTQDADGGRIYYFHNGELMDNDFARLNYVSRQMVNLDGCHSDDIYKIVVDSAVKVYQLAQLKACSYPESWLGELHEASTAWLVLSETSENFIQLPTSQIYLRSFGVTYLADDVVGLNDFVRLHRHCLVLFYKMRTAARKPARDLTALCLMAKGGAVCAVVDATVIQLPCSVRSSGIHEFNYGVINPQHADDFSHYLDDFLLQALEAKGVRRLQPSKLTWERFVETNKCCYILYIGNPIEDFDAQLYSMIFLLADKEHRCAYLHAESTKLCGENAKLVDDKWTMKAPSALRDTGPPTFWQQILRQGRRGRNESAKRDSDRVCIGSYQFFRHKKHIGSGSFGIVYRGRQLDHDIEVAIKKVLRSAGDSMLNEIEALKAWTGQKMHENLLLLLDYYEDGDDIYLVTELCIPGSLRSYFEKFEDGLCETALHHFTKQLAKALNFLERYKLVHRDIKPDNVLLQDPLKRDPETHPPAPASELTLKLADFGLCKYLTAKESFVTKSNVGSEPYMAPELLREGEYYDCRVDLWSLGVVLFECFEKQRPFNGTKEELKDEYLRVEDSWPECITFRKECSAEFRDLTTGLLRADANLRLKIADLLDHPFVNDVHTTTETNSCALQALCELSVGQNAFIGQRYNQNQGRLCNDAVRKLPTKLSNFTNRKTAEECTTFAVHNTVADRLSGVEATSQGGSVDKLDVLSGMKCVQGYGGYFIDPELMDKVCVTCVYSYKNEEERATMVDGTLHYSYLESFRTDPSFSFCDATHLISGIDYGIMLIIAVHLQPEPANIETHPIYEAMCRYHAGLKLSDGDTMLLEAWRERMRIRVFADPFYNFKTPTLDPLQRYIAEIHQTATKRATEARKRGKGQLMHHMIPIVDIMPSKLTNMSLQRNITKIKNNTAVDILRFLSSLDREERELSKTCRDAAAKDAAQSRSPALYDDFRKQASYRLESYKELRAKIWSLIADFRSQRSPSLKVDELYTLLQEKKSRSDVTNLAAGTVDTTDRLRLILSHQSVARREGMATYHWSRLIGIRIRTKWLWPMMWLWPIPEGFVCLLTSEIDQYTLQRLNNIVSVMQKLFKEGHPCCIVDFSDHPEDDFLRRLDPPRILHVKKIGPLTYVVDDDVKGIRAKYR